MTTIQIDLPDQLAEQAERAGLLSPASLEQLLRDRLNAQHRDELFAAIKRMNAANDMPYMSPEEVAKEIALMRAERRAAAQP